MSLVDCAFYNNSAFSLGGAIYQICNTGVGFEVPLQLDNVAFAGNIDNAIPPPNDIFFDTGAVQAVGNVSSGSSKYYRQTPSSDLFSIPGSIDTSILTPAEVALLGLSIVGAVLVLDQPLLSRAW